MGRCTCTDDEASRNAMVSGCGTSVTGAATVANPRHIDLVADDCGCAVMVSCITDTLCDGLSTQDGCLGLNLSANAGNRLRLGSDGGLFADCGTEAFNPCVARVSALPDFVCGGGMGAGANVAEEGIRSSYQRAAALGVDLTLSRVFRLCDGAFYVGPARDLADARYASPQPEYAKPKGLVARNTTNNAAALRVVSDGTYGDCEMVNVGLAPLTGVLHDVRNRVPLSVELPTGTGTSGTTAVTATELRALLRQNCALDRVIVHVEGTATDAERTALAGFRADGYETGVMLSTQAEADQHTPAKLTADGIRWVYAHKNLPDATITPYVTAGLQVLLMRCWQQIDVTRARALDARGVLAEDPAYVCGLPCTTGSSTWCTNAVPSGQISAVQISGDRVRASRGTRDQSDCAWYMQYTGPLPAITNATLLGFVFGNQTPPTSYTLTWEAKVPFGAMATNANSEVGLIVCCADDTVPIEGARVNPADGLAPSRTDGYVVTTTLGAPAPASSRLKISTLNRVGDPGPVQQVSVTGSPFSDNLWTKCQLVVTPTTLTFRTYTSIGTVFGEVTLADATHRGRTVWAYAVAQGAGQPTTLQHAMRNLVQT
ncbi:hypothetical protein AB0A05_27460 [Streptomyces sp. NPDC046374]|uniref:hypothetical protein n=1 Tax=Streptomyces sp. NPDC046374 TaxID=3154917 RepID=UPI0033D7AD94